MDIGNRIKARRQELGISVDELADELGKNRATIYRYEKGDIENLPTTILKPLAEALHTTPEYLIGWDDDPNDYDSDDYGDIDARAFNGNVKDKLTFDALCDKEHRKELKSSEECPALFPIESGVIIPVLGRVCAGNGSEAIEERIDNIEISFQMAQKGSHFGLVVKGDSMTPLLSDGDVVIVNRDVEAESGDLVVALVNGSDAMCKRLHRYAEGGFALIPENPVYEAKRYTVEDAGSIPVKILGKVVESRRKY